MAKQLELSDEQKAKVEALFEKQDALRAAQLKLQREKSEQVMQDRETRREEMAKLREKAMAENDAELETIIGKVKLEQWKSYRNERQKRMQDANRSGRPNTRRSQQ